MEIGKSTKGRKEPPFHEAKDIESAHAERAKPKVERLFAWIDKQFETQGFLPSIPLLAALSYIRNRCAGLSVYLDDPDVSIDTNHLERALRAVPMERRNWLFARTELDANQFPGK